MDPSSGKKEKREGLLWALATVALLAALLMLAGCGGAPVDAPPGAEGEEGAATGAGAVNGERAGGPVTIRVEAADCGYPTPFLHYPRMRGTVMKFIFDSLLEPDEEGCIPWLAESWEVSADGTTHTVGLHEGVKWHDGEEMTARDVVFSFNYYLEHPPVFIGEIIMRPGFIKSIEALSDYRVEIVTAEPNATFKCEAGMLRIIPEHIWKDVEDPYQFTGPESLIGCGPYVLTDYSREHNTYRYEAFPDYWGPGQRVDVIEYVPVSDEVLAFEKGDISLTRVSPDLLPRFEGDPGVKVVKSPAFAGYMLSFNMRDSALFAEREFRRAVAHAIDRDDLIAKVARGAGKPGSPGILPPDHQYYNPGLTGYEYDPGKAREILEGLGVREELTFELLVGEGPEVRIGEVLKEQLAQVGINVRVVAADRSTRDARVNEGKYEIALLHMGAWGLDPDFLRIRYHSGLGEDVGGSATAVLGRNQGFENPQVDRLLEKQLTATDCKEREEIILRLQELLAEEVPEIPLYNIVYYYVYRPGEYDGWMFMFDHAAMEHAKLSYLERD